MAGIKKFSFFKSYYDCLKDLKKNDKNEIINAILEYIFDDKTPNFNGVKKTIWILIEPNLRSSKNRSNPNAGAPLGNKNASKEKQSKNNQKTITEQSIDILGIGVGIGNKDKDKEWECNNTPYPHTHEEIFDYCLLEFPEYDESDLKESCENFFLYYQTNNWEGIKNWKSKAKIWMRGDIKKGTIKEKKGKIDPRRVLIDEEGRCYQENYDGTRYYI